MLKSKDKRSNFEKVSYLCRVINHKQIKINQMTTYKQKNFKRNYECTNVKFIQVLDNEVLDSNIWEVCLDSEIDCNQLFKQDNKIMFGYL